MALRDTIRTRVRLAAGLAAWLAPLALPAVVMAQSPEPLRVETSLPSDGWVDVEHQPRLSFDRPVQRPAEDVAVFFGHTDVSDLFRPVGDAIVYAAGSPPLPAGETELVVWRVRDGEWEELLRQPLRVRNRLGFERSELDPQIDLTLEGPLGGGEDPAPEFPAPDRDRQRLTGKAELATRNVRGDLTFSGSASLLGVDHRRDALRHSTLEGEAPRIDLSSYRLELDAGSGSLSMGHTRVGAHPLLLSGFASRGGTLGWTPGDRVDVELSLVNGSDVVGWDNLLGVDEPDHRLASARVGVEALERPGALRVDVTWVGASVLAGRTGINEAEINDAERSRGLGVTVAGQTPGGRLRFRGGFARSRYDNPVDPGLAGERALVSLEETIRQARYLEASAGLLDALAVGSRTVTLELALRHERADPEYRSVGAYVRADHLLNDVQLRGGVAGVDLRVSHARSSDNLDELPNLLTTRTRRTGAQATLPLAEVLGVEGDDAAWLPRLTYRHDHTHQFGEGIPENAGFSAGHVPDQVSVSRVVEAAWRWPHVTLGWRLRASDQDNRQEGREDADLHNRVHSFRLGVQPHERFTVDLELDHEERESVARSEIERTGRVGARLRLVPYAGGQVALTWSTTRSRNPAALRERDDGTFDARWSTSLPFLDGVGGQGFLRFSRTTRARLDRDRGLSDHRSEWAVHSGLSLSLFQPARRPR